MMIAIDGPAGAGKGTLARHLAHLYSLDHLDTGLLYRAVAFKLLATKSELNDHGAALQAALSLKPVDLEHPALRDEVVGQGASIIAVFPEVRQALLDFQRTFAKNPSSDKQGVILDGRDIGLFVLAEAPCKIFVTASPEVRAERRFKELQQKNIWCTFNAILEDLRERDTRDQTREFYALRPADDAFILDTSHLGIQDALEQVSFFVDSVYPKSRKVAML
jgi:cytidylate kinase